MWVWVLYWALAVAAATILFVFFLFFRHAMQLRSSAIAHLQLTEGRTWPLIGHSAALVVNGGDMKTLLEGAWSTPAVSRLLLQGERVLINEPKLALTVLTSRDYDKGPRNSVFKKLFGEGLASIQDYETWRAHRTLLRPVFQKGGIDPHQDQIHHILRERLQAIPRGSQVNISAVCREATFAVLFKLVFQSDSSSDLFQQALAALNELNRTFVFADLERYLQDTVASWIPAPNTQKCQRLIAQVHQVTEALLKNAKPGEGGVLETIVQSNLYDHKSMLDEALVLLFGGYDTTSISLQRAFLQLDKHPSEWQTLRSMVKMHFKRDDPVSSVGSGPLRDYLDALVHEVMRLDPASPMHVRYSVRATELNGFAIPENQDVFVNSVSIMRNKDIWGADADEFKPSRWLEGTNRTQLEKYWIPFGGGQRICIGNYLSMTEQYYFLANLADMFESVSIPRDPTLHDVQGITNGFSKDILGTFN